MVGGCCANITVIVRRGDLPYPPGICSHRNLIRQQKSTPKGVLLLANNPNFDRRLFHFHALCPQIKGISKGFCIIRITKELNDPKGIRSLVTIRSSIATASVSFIEPKSVLGLWSYIRVSVIRNNSSRVFFQGLFSQPFF